MADWDQPVELHVDLQEGEDVGGVILCQGTGKDKHLITLVGRDLTNAEKHWTFPEQVLAMACWGMRRLYRWVGFVPHVVVVLPTWSCQLLVRDKGVHARLRAHVLELAMYGVSYTVDDRPAGLVARLRQVSGESDGSCPEGPPPIEHEDVELKFPHGKKEAVKGVQEGAAIRMYFDGRSADKRGSGGYIIFAPDGKVLGGAACNYGVEAGTVNAAEMESLLRGLLWLKNNQHLLDAPHIVVYGDSDLTVKFLNR